MAHITQTVRHNFSWSRVILKMKHLIIITCFDKVANFETFHVFYGDLKGFWGIKHVKQINFLK